LTRRRWAIISPGLTTPQRPLDCASVPFRNDAIEDNALKGPAKKGRSLGRGRHVHRAIARFGRVVETSTRHGTPDSGCRAAGHRGVFNDADGRRVRVFSRAKRWPRTKGSGMMHPLASRSAILFATTLLISTPARAQQRDTGGGTPPPVAHQNLQVLAKDMPQAQLLAVMQGFVQGLGVQCGYCHANAPAAEAGGRGAGAGRGRGPAAPQFDFPSDDKPAKKAAREMMLLVRDINSRVPAAVGKTAETATRVQCVTCHRGVAIPKQLADILAQTAMAKGTPAALAQYRDLRKQYFGAQAYDFSETALITLAQRATAADAAGDAEAWLQLNLEYFPLSSRTYAALAQAQQKKNDKDGALKSLTRAVELDPQNAQARRQLDQLKEAK
jgi:hypothetical protein